MNRFELMVKGVVYTVQSKVADRWGKLRWDVSKEGQKKPYSMSYDPSKYQDSVVPGWGCSCKGWIYHRKCKHVTTMSEMVDVSEVA